MKATLSENGNSMDYKRFNAFKTMNKKSESADLAIGCGPALRSHEIKQILEQTIKVLIFRWNICV